jgi:N6-adenosine-specific RNA methylase IME4
VEFQGRNAVLGGFDYLDDVSVTPTQSGVLGSGYWAKHSEAWCFSNITLGCQSYTQADAMAIMVSPTRGDMTYQLAAQLAAAKLNVDCGRMDSTCVASAIAAAEPGYARIR